MLAAPAAAAVAATELDGVVMPDTRQLAGVTLHLNGIGVRTYSVFRVHIYVAALYLLTPTRDAEAILNSDAPKLMEIRFVHDVSRDDAVQAWREGFEGNCVAPCHLPPDEVARFLAAVPAFRRGDTSTLLFTRAGADIWIDGRKVGTVGDPVLANAILATFIGRDPPTERFKRQLLGEQ